MLDREALPKFLFHEGTNSQVYKYLGAHRIKKDTVEFKVWAPHAKKISLIGDFNNWDKDAHIMTRDNDIWSVQVKNVQNFDKYKYHILTAQGILLDKSDPYAFHCETSPATASKYYESTNYRWKDRQWLLKRESFNPCTSPINVYEVHFGSWKKTESGEFYSYRMLADELIPYVKALNYTHIEIMPITEYPYDGSWGYQVTGLFAPTSRYGTPDDLKYFIDTCHKNNIGVILDWVVAHFPKDGHGLYEFDGQPLYEYTHCFKAEHKEWGTMVFDYGKPEVRSFLISSANYWIEEFHFDGLRVDAVASMLYLDYNRKHGEWQPNKDGNNYNLEAISFLQQLNNTILSKHKGAMMIAEESTAFPMVTKPSYDGGLGFNLKWNMGWMNDMLSYVQANPFFRKDMHDKITFSLTYAFSENYILPLSHDEVVHGKKSLLEKTQGSYEEKFSALKAFFGYMMAHPGKKLLFMGGEFGQFIEWDYKKSLDWFLLEYPQHKNLQKFVKELNKYYLEHCEMHDNDSSFDGFKWLCVDDKTQNIVSFIRKSPTGKYTMAIINFSPVSRDRYEVGVPENKGYKVRFNSNSEKFGGDELAYRIYKAKKGNRHGQPFYIRLNIPAYSVIFLKVSDK